MSLQTENQIRKANQFFITLQSKCRLTPKDEKAWHLIAYAKRGVMSHDLALKRFEEYLKRAKQTTMLTFVKEFEL